MVSEISSEDSETLSEHQCRVVVPPARTGSSRTILVSSETHATAVDVVESLYRPRST